MRSWRRWRSASRTLPSSTWWTYQRYAHSTAAAHTRLLCCIRSVSSCQTLSSGKQQEAAGWGVAAGAGARAHGADCVGAHSTATRLGALQVPDFNTMYELYDPCTTMFFFRNKHIMIDLGTGNNNKINWAMGDKQVRAGGTAQLPSRQPLRGGHGAAAAQQPSGTQPRSQARTLPVTCPASKGRCRMGRRLQGCWRGAPPQGWRVRAAGRLQEFIDIVETVYRGARKGRGLVVSPKDYSTKYRY